MLNKYFLTTKGKENINLCYMFNNKKIMLTQNTKGEQELTIFISWDLIVNNILGRKRC